MTARLKLIPSKPKPAKRDVAKRWTARLAKGGFTPVVSTFLEHYARMVPPLTTPEAMLVIHLISFKWDNAMPWPAFKTLAKRMGVTATAVRNHARNLDKRKKYLVRHKRVGKPNLFDLSPLFDALEKVQAAEERRKRLEERRPQRAGA